MTQNSESALRVLLIEDDNGLRNLLREELIENGYEVTEADCLQRGQAAIRESIPDIVISDIRLPDGSGEQMVQEALQFSLPPPVLLITAFGQVEEAVQALQQGAADFLTKPLEIDHLLLRLDRLVETHTLRRQLAALRHGHSFEEEQRSGKNPEILMLGESPSWKQIEKQLPLVSRTEDPVLITGPSGSGKELVAHEIHKLSSRSNQPFTPVNCAGIPEQLLESELFGHKAGAFTGANKDREGLFLASDGGTLFLDEIGEMPLTMQSKLLRVLQEKRVRAVGSDWEKEIDVRILAATNLDLDHQIEKDLFRRDLFYRLETFHLKLPPLRERPEDIELLSMRFMNGIAAEIGKKLNGIAPSALDALRRYHYPGNIRELKNIIRRAVAFSEGPWLEVRHLPDKLRNLTPELDATSSGNEDLVSMETVRRRHARKVLELCGGNKQKTARILEVSRPTLYSLLEEG